MDLSSNSSESGTDAPDYNSFEFPYLARFLLYLLLDIPAIICSLTILTVFFIDRQCRNALQNHAIIFLIIIVLICQVWVIPIYIDQLRVQEHWSMPIKFCYAWRYIDSSCFAATPVLLSWLSFERNILIFNNNFYNNRKNKILFHYIPPSFLVTYIFIFYSYAIFFPPCENTFDALCGGVCFFYVTWLSLWDLIGHNIIPTFLIIVFNITVVIRTIQHKKRLNQAVQWRKLRRMTLQLVSMSSLFLIFCLPATICFSLLPFGTFNTDALFNVLPYAAYFSYYPQLLLPFICFFNIPELSAKTKHFFRIRQRRLIHSLTNRTNIPH